MAKGKKAAPKTKKATPAPTNGQKKTTVGGTTDDSHANQAWEKGKGVTTAKDESQ